MEFGGYLPYFYHQNYNNLDDSVEELREES